MGIWDFVCSGVQMLGQCVPDEEGRDTMIKFLKIASFFAAKEAANNISGVRAVNEICNATVREMNNASKKN